MSEENAGYSMGRTKQDGLLSEVRGAPELQYTEISVGAHHGAAVKVLLIACRATGTSVTEHAPKLGLLTLSPAGLAAYSGQSTEYLGRCLMPAVA